MKISDFGTCRTWNDISVEMSFIGTYAWMAPEVIRKELCSEKVDVWLVFSNIKISYYFPMKLIGFNQVVWCCVMGVADG